MFGTEQKLGIDFELHSLESGDTDNRQKYGYHEKVPGMSGYDVAKPIKGFCQPFIDAFYAASHVWKKQNKRYFNKSL